jgi:hypothetical protein
MNAGELVCQRTALEERALRREGNRSVPWSGLQTEFVERTPGKNAIVESSTEEGIEAVRLGAFAPPASPLERHSVVALTVPMNEPG